MTQVREIPSVFETDADGEAIGIVHVYCSEDCRNRNDLPFGENTVYGLSHWQDLCDGITCETCGKSLD